jgi:hypothetical protein
MKKKHSWQRRAGALALATLAGACSDVATPDAPGGGGSGAMSAAGAAGAPSPGGATTGGPGGAGGTPSGGADAGGVGVAGSAVIGGSSGSGGIAGGGGRAAEGGAGASGAAGSRGGETAGNGGATAGSAGTTAGTSGAGGSSPTLAIAAELSGFRLECPCIDANHFGPEKQDNCDSAPAVDRQKHDKKLGGEPSQIYDVGLRVRGNTEPNTYVGGKLEQGRFYVGGKTSTPGYTAYMMTVSDPPQTYFFNYNATTGHLHFLLDYQVSVPMRGGATVTFEVNGGSSVPDGHGVSNRERLVVPGVPPAPDPFNGQFVQVDVVSVELRAEP